MYGVWKGLRNAVLHELGEELRTHGKYAGWHRLFLALEEEGQGQLTIGRIADRLGKDYHGTYVQIGRFRDFVASWSRRNGHSLGATVELVVDGGSAPTAVELAVRPLVPRDTTVALTDTDHSLLSQILGAIRNALASNHEIPAEQYETLRQSAAKLREVLDAAAWKSKQRADGNAATS